jgi:hypothetical protein
MLIVKAHNPGSRKAAVMDAQHLVFRDGSFDTVSILDTCTFPDPVEACVKAPSAAQAGAFYSSNMVGAIVPALQLGRIA